MRRALLLLTVLAGCGAAPAAPGTSAPTAPAHAATARPPDRSAPAAIVWHPTLESAKAASRKDGKPVMVFFEFDA